MHLAELPPAFLARLRHPGRGAWLLLLGLAWAGLRLMLDAPYGRFQRGEAFLPLALLLGSFALAPLAWQWTGDDRPIASITQGLIQSLAWNGLWLLALTWIFGSLGVAGPPRPSRMNQPLAPPFREGPPRDGAQRLPPPDHPPPDHPPRGAQDPRPHPPAPGSPELFFLSLGLILSTVLGRSLAEADAGRAREGVLQRQAEAAQALALQAQMQPHALFNALSGLVELAREDSQATEEALVALCDYLRRLMTHARVSVGPLKSERELIEDYLRLEQIRLGDRLRVQWAWPAWADAISLPPLLLQPLVENAILHGIAPEAKGGDLRVALSRRGGTLCLEVSNTGRPPAMDREGMGLGHLRDRLALWRPGVTLDLDHEGGWTCARILIPEAAIPC